LNTNNKPGSICAQINECLNPSLHNCDSETQACVDLPPPTKWQCVERTPAPTPAPTCNDDGVTIISRESDASDLSKYDDIVDCKLLQETSSPDLGGWSIGVCNCKGKYFSSDGLNYKELIVSNRKAATVANVCCYCQARQGEVCIFDL
jgi:hypothetical protein